MEDQPAFKIAIKNNETGEIRFHVEEGKWTDNEFLWTDGNYACDCNRRLLFERINNPEFDCNNLSCGNELYSIYVEEDGKIVYKE